jgi:hypothetical protein
VTVALSDTIQSIACFGDSWCWGSELEKSLGAGYKAMDQDSFRERNRFTALVAQHFGWQEKNFGEPGISAEHLVQRISQYLKSPCQDELILIVWPSFTRYFWIDEKNHRQDIRISDQWSRWYRDVDNYAYMMYSAQRSIWSLQNLLKVQGQCYIMINSVTRVTAPWHFDIDVDHWPAGVQSRLSDLLGFDVDQGYPQEHQYLSPCENHPNVYGHKCIAREIINYLSRETQS